MEEKLAKRLMWWYYSMLGLAVVAATSMYLLLSKGCITTFEAHTVVGQVIQYVVIGWVIATVPGSLAYTKYVCNKIKKADEDIRFARYYNVARLRIVLIGIGVSLGIVAFYLLQGNTSMIFCGGIAAIGLIFCKPNARKIELELLDENPTI